MPTEIEWALELEVKCDEPGCGWKQEVDLTMAAEWHNRPCPRCGKGVIINDWEMRLLKRILKFANSNVMSLTPAEKALLVYLGEIDTAPLRPLRKCEREAK